MDWRKWIIERLPERLRVTGMIAVCMVLTLPIRVLYEEFVAWQRKMRTQVAGTPQVCMLEKIIRDELGLDIRIEEGNGKPIDFIIKTDFVDMDKERRLFALLDRYKLAGKSYGYENAGIVITAQWTRFVCELAGMESEWTGFVCERKGKRDNLVTADVLGYGFDLKITAQYPVSGLLPIHFKVGSETTERTVYYTSTQENQAVTFPVDATGGNTIVESSVRLGITEDDEYVYEFRLL